MSNILISGSKGFVGQNLMTYLNCLNLITISLRYQPSKPVQLDETDDIIHLSGKAHDLKKQQPICLIQSTYSQ